MDLAHPACVVPLGTMHPYTVIALFVVGVLLFVLGGLCLTGCPWRERSWLNRRRQ